jgi:hypothetical protein
MEIPSKRVYTVLRDAGVECIHHANSVSTACQFLRSGSLISRGAVERCGLYQIPQNSDGIDKRYGIWFAVFAESVDIHKRAGKANVYGPALFVLDLEIIKKSYTGKVWVTMLNPSKWAGRSHNEKWFTSKKDLESNSTYGEFTQMIVLRHSGGELPFGKYLQEIILARTRISRVRLMPHITVETVGRGCQKVARSRVRVRLGTGDVSLADSAADSGCSGPRR